MSNVAANKLSSNALSAPRSDAGARRASSGVENLGSKEFLRLMVAQLKNQDPTKPIDGTKFVAQLAQFGTVSGVRELNNGFASLVKAYNVSRGYQSANLVGRRVATNSNLGQLRAVGGDKGAMALTATVRIKGKVSGGAIYIQDLKGRLVHRAPLPAGASGDLQIKWDGLDRNGKRLPAGSYRVSAKAQINGSKSSKALLVFAHQKVLSVSINSTTGGTTLNLANGQSVPVSAVRQFL